MAGGPTAGGHVGAEPNCLGEELNMKKMILKIEDLEERIAPSFVFVLDSPPDRADASPVGPRGDETFGPSIPDFPAQGNLAAWSAHSNSPVLDSGGT
jgi:hypothetical protein